MIVTLSHAPVALAVRRPGTSARRTSRKIATDTSDRWISVVGSQMRMRHFCYG